MKTALLILALFSPQFGVAADCDVDKKPADLTLSELAQYYTCVRYTLAEAYQGGDNPITKAYTSWQAGATGPAKPGFHSNRYLMTYINDIGYDTYVDYATEDVDMPVGSVLAKESFSINNRGQLSVGPLFIMEKVGLEQATKTAGWFYSAVKADGKDMRVQQAFCHGCHQAYQAQDAMAYPVRDVRIPQP